MLLLVLRYTIVAQPIACPIRSFPLLSAEALGVFLTNIPHFMSLAKHKELCW
jgi:hypothetical protein